jgi:soluble lytic murein transglycosylase-like protein
MTNARGAVRALAAMLVAGSALCATQANAAPAQALTPWDAQLYAAAFDAVRKGDFKTAADLSSQAKDNCLVGMVEFQKLFHPSAYKATYQELTDWLSKYGDLPAAKRVYALALKRKPEGEVAPPPPAAEQRTWSSIDEALAAAEPKAAREALNRGDLKTAYSLAIANGEPWVAGLAAYRLKNYTEAFKRFELVALDVTEDPWVRSGGAYWAARAAMAKGEAHRAPEFLHVAAQFPATFYGMVAERQLGLEPKLRQGPRAYTELQPTKISATGAVASMDTPELRAFIKRDARARRAVALSQLGQAADAGLELRTGLRQAKGDDTRLWAELARALNSTLSDSRARKAPDADDYPVPALEPQGGFTVDKALVYALARKESGFDPTVTSYAGAYGLLQVMPATAALVAGDDKFKSEPTRLLDPAVNLRLGQDYIASVMGHRAIGGDILRAIAAYNGGPGLVARALDQLPADADPLLVMESIPSGQTRQYVEEVAAAYSVYARLLGQEDVTFERIAARDPLAKLKVTKMADAGSTVPTE